MGSPWACRGHLISRTPSANSFFGKCLVLWKILWRFLRILFSVLRILSLEFFLTGSSEKCSTLSKNSLVVSLRILFSVLEFLSTGISLPLEFSFHKIPSRNSKWRSVIFIITPFSSIDPPPIILSSGRVGRCSHSLMAGINSLLHDAGRSDTLPLRCRLGMSLLMSRSIEPLSSACKMCFLTLLC